MRKGKRAARIIMRSHILLLTSDGKPDAIIAETLHIGVRTVERTRQKFVEGGLEWALSDRPSSAASRQKLNGKQEAFLIASACCEPPQGRATPSQLIMISTLFGSYRLSPDFDFGTVGDACQRLSIWTNGERTTRD